MQFHSHLALSEATKSEKGIEPRAKDSQRGYAGEKTFSFPKSRKAERKLISKVIVCRGWIAEIRNSTILVHNHYIGRVQLCFGSTEGIFRAIITNRAFLFRRFKFGFSLKKKKKVHAIISILGRTPIIGIYCL